VIGVLGHRHVHREGHRVAAAGDESRRAERRVDAAALAAVLLAAMLDDAEGALDDIDLLRLFELPVPLTQLAAAVGAGAVGLIEAMDGLDHGQRWLCRGAVTTRRLRRLLCLPRGGRRTLLRGAAKQRLGAGSELLLEEPNLEFELGRHRPPRLRELTVEHQQALVEPGVLAIEQAGDVAEPLDVGLSFDVHHTENIYI